MAEQIREAPTSPAVAAEVAGLCTEFAAGLRESLGDALTSLYLYGALVFPRPPAWQVDIDFHALIARRLTDDERQAVTALHERIAASDLGMELDGYYITMDDAVGREPPTGVAGVFPSTCGSVAYEATDRAWALHRAHVRAGRFVLLYGTDPREILAPATWEELEEALDGELDYVEAHPEHPAYGVLNACRILYSLRHRDVVVSKHEAAQWGERELTCDWREAIAAAVRCYTRTATAGDRELVSARRAAFAAEVRAELERVSSVSP